MRLFVSLAVLACLSGCGSCSRANAYLSGYSSVCVSGIEYLQFPSGVSVKMDKDGKPMPCNQ